MRPNPPDDDHELIILPPPDEDGIQGICFGCGRQKRVFVFWRDGDDKREEQRCLACLRDLAKRAVR